MTPILLFESEFRLPPWPLESWFPGQPTWPPYSEVVDEDEEVKVVDEEGVYPMIHLLLFSHQSLLLSITMRTHGMLMQIVLLARLRGSWKNKSRNCVVRFAMIVLDN